MERFLSMEKWEIDAMAESALRLYTSLKKISDLKSKAESQTSWVTKVVKIIRETTPSSEGLEEPKSSNSGTLSVPPATLLHQIPAEGREMGHSPSRKFTASSEAEPKNGDKLTKNGIKLDTNDEGQLPSGSTTLFRALRSEERASKKIASNKISEFFQPSKYCGAEEEASSELISRMDDCVVRIKEEKIEEEQEDEEEVCGQGDEIIVKNEIDLD